MRSFFVYPKNMILVVFFIGLSILIPGVANADLWGGFLIQYPPAFFLLVFLGVWMIEAVYISKKIPGNSKKAVWAAFFVNLFTTCIGVVAAILLERSDLLEGFEIFYYFLPSFILSVVIEFVCLRFFYNKETIGQLFEVGLVMNLRSYAFMIAYLLAEGTGILLIVALPWLFYYFSKNFIDLAFPGLMSKPVFNSLSKGLLFIFVAFLVGFVFWFGVKDLPPKNIGARDVRRVADLRQAQNALELYFDKCGFYPGLVNCEKGSVSNWDDLGLVLTGSGLDVYRISNDPAHRTYGDSYSYAVSGQGNAYVLRAKLEYNKSNLLKDDLDGDVYGLDCDDGDGKNYYCVTL